jgi:co-chaperonin GroES (HSP10)
MHNPGFRPNKLRYLVLPTAITAQETKVEGSQYSIETAKDPHEKPSQGTVVALGKDCSEFQLGAIVLYGRYSGYEQHFDGNDYLILAETELLGEMLVTPFDDK